MDISFFAHDLNVIFTGGVFGTTALADNITKLENKNTMCINAVFMCPGEIFDTVWFSKQTNQKMNIIQVDIHKRSTGKFRIKNIWKLAGNEGVIPAGILAEG